MGNDNAISPVLQTGRSGRSKVAQLANGGTRNIIQTELLLLSNQPLKPAAKTELLNSAPETNELEFKEKLEEGGKP